MSAFIDEHRGRFGVEPICRTLDVSASAYYQRASEPGLRETQPGSNPRRPAPVGSGGGPAVANGSPALPEDERRGTASVDSEDVDITRSTGSVV